MDDRRDHGCANGRRDASRPLRRERLRHEGHSTTMIVALDHAR
jgi:hypothetical protein